MQSTQATPADLLAARTARGLSIKAAADEMGLDFTKLTNFNRGKWVTDATRRAVADWVAAQPSAAPDPVGEQWRSVVGWEGFYEVSSHGRVRSVERTIPHRYSGKLTIRSRVLKQHAHPSGHLMVMLARSGSYPTRKVHQLVLEAFVGPGNGLDGCHNDGVEDNNDVHNLRWDTRAENMLDRVWHESNRGTVRPEVAERLTERQENR